MAAVAMLTPTLMVGSASSAAAAPPPEVSRLTIDCRPDDRSDQAVREFMQAYNMHDIARARALTSDDFTRYSVTTPRAMKKDAWSDMWVRFDNAFPDESWTVQSTRNCGDTVSVQVVETGTFTEPWVFPDGYVEHPTGRPYRADSVIVFRLDEDRKFSSYLQFTTPAFLEVNLTPGALAAIVRNGY